MRLVLATRNSAKAGEMKRILARLLPDWEILDLNSFPPFPEPEETADTYAGNARIKAVASAQATGELCLADDAGLEIAALDGAPGVHSKRFGGEDLPFPEKMRLVLEKLDGIPPERRQARFRCAVAIADSEGWQQVVEATCDGFIAEEPRGEGGFGYDPIFYYPNLGKTFGELTADEKDSVSHRGKVLKLAAEALRRWPAGATIAELTRSGPAEE
ncbi:MAG: non-canonical purine NTP pyrophosphatase [Fimbriimonadales bacterium]|nr:MAG: non-canonical purine NTP pyrophosphatase [Fimbriimonadales bacterium]